MSFVRVANSWYLFFRTSSRNIYKKFNKRSFLIEFHYVLHAYNYTFCFVITRSSCILYEYSIRFTKICQDPFHPSNNNRNNKSSSNSIGCYNNNKKK